MAQLKMYEVWANGQFILGCSFKPDAIAKAKEVKGCIKCNGKIILQFN